MERKLLDMTNRLFISGCNSRVEYGDKFKLKSGKNVNGRIRVPFYSLQVMP